MDGVRKTSIDLPKVYDDMLQHVKKETGLSMCDMVKRMILERYLFLTSNTKRKKKVIDRYDNNN